MIRLAPFLLALFAWSVGPACALDRVTIGANWLAEAEHGGFYQAIADGTYARYGLDVTILPGGPQKNNRLLLAAGKIDFYMGDNLIGEFSAVSENVPIVTVAAIFQKDPLVFMSHPSAGLDRFRGSPQGQGLRRPRHPDHRLACGWKNAGVFRAKKSRPIITIPRLFWPTRIPSSRAMRRSGAFRHRAGRRVQAQRLPARRLRL